MNRGWSFKCAGSNRTVCRSENSSGRIHWYNVKLLIEIKRTYGKTQIIISHWGGLLRSLRDTHICPDAPVNTSIATTRRHQLDIYS